MEVQKTEDEASVWRHGPARGDCAGNVERSKDFSVR